ncbi:MAG: carboxypeptidase regulatory-like domain-containing protein [Bacteroidota bacterium]
MKKYIFLLFILATAQTTFSQISISGKVQDANAAAICGASVELLDENGTSLATTLTDENGDFSYTDLAAGATYQVRVEKADAILNGLSTFDLVLMNNHILGVRLIENPFILYAADLNASASLSVYDLILLRRIILGIDSEVSIPVWQFFSRDANAADLNDPATIQTQRFENLTTSIETADFIGYKSADINFTATNSCGN